MTTKIFTITNGFYFFGTENDSPPEGYLSLTKAAMFGNFGGGKGVAGVSRGDKSATVTLDKFDQDEELLFPISSVVAVLPCIDLYSFKGTTIR